MTVLAPAGSSRLVRALGFLCPTPAATLACALVCVVAPVAIVAVHIHRSPSFSVVDEEAHFDYVQRVAEGSLPRLGQQLLPSTDSLVRCIGRPPEGFTLPACHASRSVIDAFERSVNDAQYEAQQPPLYYAVTAVMRWPFIHILHLGVLAGTRFTGAFWLAAGLLLVWVAARILGLEWSLVAAGVLLLASAPNVVFEASVVSNDSSAIFAGGLAAVAGAMAWRQPGRLPWWSFALVGLVAVALKAVFVLPVITVAVLLLVDACVAGGTRASGTRRPPTRESAAVWLPTGGVMLIGAVFGLGAWTIVFHELSLVNPKTFVPLRLAADGHTGVADLANNALAMLFPFTNSAGPVFQWTVSGAVPSSPWLSALSTIDGHMIALLAIGGGLSWLFVSERTWPHWLGAASLLIMYLGGLALGVSILVTYRYNSDLPGRYALSTSVLLVLALIGAMNGRWPKMMLWTLSLATLVLTFWLMLV